MLLFHGYSVWFYSQNAYTGSISVGTIVLGAFVAGARDLSFDSYGYSIVIVSNIATAIYLSCISRIGNISSSFVESSQLFRMSCDVPIFI